MSLKVQNPSARAPKVESIEVEDDWIDKVNMGLDVLGSIANIASGIDKLGGIPSSVPQAPPPISTVQATKSPLHDMINRTQFPKPRGY